MLRTIWPNFGPLLPCLFFFIAATATTPLKAQPSLSLGLSAAAKGNAAVTALGPNIAEVAQSYGIDSQRLATLLRTQPSLGIDLRGALFYACAAPTATAPANTLLPGSSTVQLANGNAVDAFQLHSLPGASKVIYLDFNGHTTSGTIWNSSFTGGNAINSGAFDLDGDPQTFNATERAVITAIWKRVTEDFAPFAVDVTTQDPGIEALRKTSNGDQSFGIRVVISPSNWYNGGAGGVGYVGSFSWNSDTPVFVFTQQLANAEKYIAEAISHEVGHSTGLNHDGLTGPNATEYYAGQSNWAPIMGLGYYASVTQFSRGEYQNANNTEDDLAIISTFIPYATDDHGNTTATASTLAVNSLGVVADGGTIERSTDVDVFRFGSSTGPLALTIQSPSPEANLKLRVELLDAGGSTLQTSNAPGMSAAISRAMTSGTYYLRVRGEGAGDPFTNGYSAYGSIGNFLITGTVTLNAPPVAIIGASQTSGTAPLTVNFSSAGSNDPDGTIVSYAWTFGNGATASTANPSYTYNTAGSFTATVTVTDNGGATHSANVGISVSGSVVAPQITTQPLSQTVTSGANVTFTAAALGSPAPTFQWRKNGTGIAGATNATLTLPAVTTADAASYTLVATNAAGSATSNTATLTVNTAPQITTQPASQTVNVGASVTFTAAASGTPAPTLQWRKNGTAIAGATTAALTLPAVTAADAASYTLVATNAAGAATSNPATLTVTTSGDLTTALLNHWRMDEGAGTLAADSAGSAHGTIVNGPTWTSGKIGPFALGLSAATGSHVVASQPSDAPYVGALTIAAWINVTPGAGDAVVASKVSANGAQNNPFDFIVLGSGALYFVRANGSYCAWASTATLGSGWHHVAVVAPDANVNSAPTFYVNGVAVGTSNLALFSGGPATGDGSPIRVGRRADGAGQLTGAIDDVRIYGRALPASDLAALCALAAP
ncbi:MAG: immunoglobulin domain-containing protein [Opitutaceae bacterium]|nr:immunoglobulin domain-containing protein [Opitutaceae bacterium]